MTKEIVDIKSNETPTNALTVNTNLGSVVPANEIPWGNSNIMENMDLGSFYSIKPVTPADKIKLYNAINTPDQRLADHINTVIEVKDVLVEIVELENDTTGELQKCPRIILIDKDGVSYQCVSVGIMSGLKRIFKLFGEPTWEIPVKMKIKQITKGKKQMLSLEVVA